MEKQTLYDFLRELVDDGKGDEIYKLLDFNESMILVTMSAKSMLDCLGFSTFLNRTVNDIFRNNIILDCDVVINVTKC